MVRTLRPTALAILLLCALPAVAFAGVPVLAGSNKPYGAGFGQSRPRTIWLGGDPSGVVCRIHWLTWGQQLAIGTGTAEYVGPNEDVAHGHWSPAVVVLSKLGPWRGKIAYRHFTWTFPESSTRSPRCQGY